MSKNKSKRKKQKHNRSIQYIETKRTGGQNALRGYSYQLLYSCLVILNAAEKESFRLEGVEDIDVVDSTTTHIQIKYSRSIKDASFLDAILKNFVEVYLIDTSRQFKLVYDFPVKDGNLKHLIQKNPTPNSTTFWKNKIEIIKRDNPYWNWDLFEYERFFSQLSFEYVSKDCLETQLESSLINSFGITTDNLELYSNALKFL